MKLLNKSFKPFLIFTVLTVLLSIPLFYVAIHHVYINDADQSLLVTKAKLEDRINDLSSDLESAEKMINVLNELNISYTIRPLGRNMEHSADSIYTVERYDAYHGHEEPFRVLETVIFIHGAPFLLKVEVDMEEYYDVIPYTALIAGLFFLTILLGYYSINRIISKRVWQPFYQILNELESYQINSNESHSFLDSNVDEFNKLSQILNSFIQRNKAIYQQQKEFTENASHELQTPLAIFQSKLDILLQNQDLTSEQAHIIEQLYDASSRLSRVNKNLLLLARIAHKHFSQKESLEVKTLIEDVLPYFSEQAEEKQLSMHTEMPESSLIEANKGLTEILINNLILNAIRHNIEKGTICMILAENLLTVRNTGIDKPLHTDSLFQRFSKSTEHAHSSGLGLAIVKKIADLNQWKVTYSYQDDQHIFSVRF